jgi:hypothetical protein
MHSALIIRKKVALFAAPQNRSERLPAWEAKRECFAEKLGS